MGMSRRGYTNIDAGTRQMDARVGSGRRVFYRSLKAAIDHARSGGEAVYMHRVLSPSDPESFLTAYANDEYLGSLFDRDAERLARTANELGIGFARVHRPGTDGQHIRLCGTPLAYALMGCENAP
jgi:LDH2 family malate/lactate/ureidoglycolate dehydrogenase